MKALSPHTFIVPLVLLCFASLGFSETFKVPQDHPTIQEAIDVSDSGDTILVAPGTYEENIDFLGKEITVSQHPHPEREL